MDQEKRQKIPRKGKVAIRLTFLFSTILVLVCLSDVQHPRESSLYVRLMYDSSCCIKEAVYYYFFTFMSRSSFTHFRFSFFISLTIGLYIYISRHLLTTKMHIFMFYFPHQIAKHYQQNANANAKWDAQYTFSYAKPGTSGSQNRLIFFLNSSYTISS